jgi:predicted transcriptional regulator of viral defense system
MNVYGIDNIPVNGYRQAPSLSRGASAGFGDVFHRELTALEKTSDTPADSGGTDPMAQLLSRGEDILTLLETYAADLKNPGRTLRQMAPLVDVIEQEIHQFEKKATARFSGDQALLEWANDLSLTARIATAKFHRGDFL